MRSSALLAMALALLTSAVRAQIAPVLTIHLPDDRWGRGDRPSMTACPPWWLVPAEQRRGFRFVGVEDADNHPGGI